MKVPIIIWITFVAIFSSCAQSEPKSVQVATVDSNCIKLVDSLQKEVNALTDTLRGWARIMDAMYVEQAKRDSASSLK